MRAFCLFTGLFLASLYLLGLMVRIDAGAPLVHNMPAMVGGFISICVLLAIGLASPKFPE